MPSLQPLQTTQKKEDIINMPIKDKTKYPANWKIISEQERHRAGNKCELCQATNHQPHPLTGSKVILTVHHIQYLDGPENNAYPNLIVLCQRCHNRLDMGMRIRNARRTRQAKNGAISDLFRNN